MQETYTLIVKTADGECLIQKVTTGNLLDLYALLSQLSSQLWYQYMDSLRSEILHGSGIGQSASDSSLPTES